MTGVTEILVSIERGDRHAAEQLLPLVYEELRKLAAARMAHERSDHTLQATALVHEAYIRLVDTQHAQHWNSRGHFFAAAAEAMRRILVERARRKECVKEGGGHRRVEAGEFRSADETSPIDLLALDDALEQLAATDPRRAQLVKLRFFAGLTNEQAADALGISSSTADNDWAYAKTWLRLRMTGG